MLRLFSFHRLVTGVQEHKPLRISALVEIDFFTEHIHHVLLVNVDSNSLLRVCHVALFGLIESQDELMPPAAAAAPDADAQAVSSRDILGAHDGQYMLSGFLGESDRL